MHVKLAVRGRGGWGSSFGCSKSLSKLGPSPWWQGRGMHPHWGPVILEPVPTLPLGPELLDIAPMVELQLHCSGLSNAVPGELPFCRFRFSRNRVGVKTYRLVALQEQGRSEDLKDGSSPGMLENFGEP